MNVVDSSGWLEYLADAPNAGFFADAIKDAASLIVPTISLLEVFKPILQQRCGRRTGIFRELIKSAISQSRDFGISPACNHAPKCYTYYVRT